MKSIAQLVSKDSADFNLRRTTPGTLLPLGLPRGPLNEVKLDCGFRL